MGTSKIHTNQPSPGNYGEETTPILPKQPFVNYFSHLQVEHRRLNLLSHPLILYLLHQKWLKFGQYVYYLNLFTYCLFLVFLTTFALLNENPRSPFCEFQKYEAYHLTRDRYRMV